MKTLTPIILKEKFFSGIEAEINRIYWEIIYKPLIESLGVPAEEITNAIGALAHAIEQGKVWFEDGKFHGEFNSKISKELRDMGAKYNSRSQTWTFTGLIPVELSFAQTFAIARYRSIANELVRTLDSLNIASINAVSALQKKYDQTITWMDDDFVKTVRAVTIAPELTPNQKSRIALEWAENLNVYIKDWAAGNVLKLRQKVLTNSFSGQRAEALVKGIQENYGVSRRKAKFLARQETSLLLSKFHETRYAEVGITKYRWSTAHDERVRGAGKPSDYMGPNHAVLNDKVFYFTDPPVTDPMKGTRANPGEDFGCRCVAIPIIE